LTIYDETGSIVYSGAMGSLEAGEGSVYWDGKGLDGQNLAEGKYTFSLSGFDGNGDVVQIQELMVGVVDGMSYETGVPTPSISDVIFDLSQILRVEIAEE
jgi:flagellar basal-body rod modification protein FlgD